MGCLGVRVWVVLVTGCGLFRSQGVGCLGHRVWVYRSQGLVYKSQGVGRLGQRVWVV